MQFLIHYSESIIYLLVFLIVLGEIGVVALFFLPGDTLLFSLGMFADQGLVSLPIIIGVVFVAACIGNIVGYETGRYVRGHYKQYGLFKRVPERYILKTEHFYQKYGALTVILSRFIPVVRTIAPALAGVGNMPRRSFIALSIVGGLIWATVMPTIGYTVGRFLDLKNVEYLGMGLMLAAVLVFPLIIFIAKRLMKKGEAL